MKNLGERYLAVMEYQDKLRIEAEKEQRKLNWQKKQMEKECIRLEQERLKLEKALEIYDEALENLTSYKEEDLRIFGTNLYGIKEKKEEGKEEVEKVKEVCFLYKRDFDKKLKNEKKDEYHSAIHTVLLSKPKEYAKNFVNAPNHYMDYMNNPYLYQYLSENTIKFLYEFSGGDFKTIFTLSRLCTDIFNGVTSIKKPYVILADKKLHRTINYLLWCFSDGSVSNIDFYELKKMKKLNNLFIDRCNGSKLAVSCNDKIPESESDVKMMKKIMRGKIISKKHPSFPGYVHFCFNMPFVYVTDNHLAYKKMKVLYNAVDIKITSENLTAFKHDEYIMEFIKYNFYNLVYDSRIDKSKYRTVLNKTEKDNVFGDFIDKCCIIDDDAVCEKNLLYEAYLDYYKKYFGDEPLTRIMFSKKFAIFGNFETVRPHSSRKHYPYCFKGISLDEDKIKDFINADLIISRYFSNYEIFKKKLIELLCKTRGIMY